MIRGIFLTSIFSYKTRPQLRYRGKNLQNVLKFHPCSKGFLKFYDLFCNAFHPAPGYKECCLTMKQILLGSLLFFLQHAYAQTPGIDIPEMEKYIRRTMTSEPDSARIFIRQILNHKGKLHDTVYGNAYIAYAYYHHLKNNTDSSLYYYRRARPFINEYKFPKNYARLLRNRAGTHKRRGESEEALKILSQVEKIYQSLKDDTGLAIVYGEIASNYNLLLRNKEAINYLLKALDLLELQNEKKYIVSVKVSLANSYMNAGNFKFAEDLYLEALKAYKEQNVIKNYSVTLVNYGDCLIFQKKYPEARKALNDALPGLIKFNDQELIGVVYSKMGTIELEQGNTKGAESYYYLGLQKVLASNSLKTITIATEYMTILKKMGKIKEAMEIIRLVEKPVLMQKTNVSDKMDFEKVKSEIYEKINNTDKALLSLEARLKLQDTLNRTVNNEAALKLQQEYQNKYQEKKKKSLKSTNTSLKEELYHSRLATLIPLFGVCLLLIAATTIYILKTKKHTEKLKLARTKKEQLLDAYQETKKLNITHLQNIESKKQELVSGMVSLASLDGNISRLIALCRENPEDLDIECIKGQLISLTSDNDYWKLFKLRFNDTYKNFQCNLSARFPALTKNDLFFCALLKLNLPYKDMATLMQVSPESIVKKKYRVKKKMEIETEQELDSILLHTPL